MQNKIELSISEGEILEQTIFNPIYAVARIMKGKGIPAYVAEAGDDIKVASGKLYVYHNLFDRKYKVLWEE